MCKISEEDVQRKMDECSTKSESELLDELLDSGVSSDDFLSFKEVILPMLSKEQAEKLAEIERELGKKQGS